jgi:NAD(P)-dependent dehydrogenase (short-subunit alcohol dehydrogenase family)
MTRSAPFDLTGRTALVTGASRGIGAATARALDRAGARVAVVARTRGALEAAAGELANDPLVVVADLADAGAPQAIADETLAALGSVDVLVNNAAAAARMPSTELGAEVIDRMLAVNVRNLLLLTTAVLPSMVERRSGSIVNLSSVSGVIGTPNRSAYAATKGAVDAMTRSLAVEFGPHGIRVNAVAPGVIDTDLWASNKKIPGVIERIEEQTPLRRWGTAEDVADVIVFLASDASRFVTAQTISVDGGMAHTLDLYGGAV